MELNFRLLPLDGRPRPNRRRPRRQGARGSSLIEALEQRIAPATFVVTSAGDVGAGTLRQALLDAASNGSTDLDTISFSIPGSGLQTIHPLTPLPDVSANVFIDGYSQPGASKNSLSSGSNAVLLVQLTGDLTADNTSDIGLRFSGGSSSVSGLIINNFSSYAIAITGGSGSKVAGNWIGTDPTGLAGITNSTQGISISNSSGNFIGGSAPADRNVIASNAVSIDITASSPDTVIQGNYIGIGRDGTTSLGNTFTLYSLGARTIVGGLNTGEGNVIASTIDDYGVYIRGASATDSKIEGNLIGVDASGTLARGNASQGIFSDAPNLTIRGNVVSANGFGGLRLGGNNPLVQGNQIGTDKSGAVALSNAGPGIQIDLIPDLNTTPITAGIVGGTGQGEANRIAFNAGAGVAVGNSATGIAIRANSIDGNTGRGIQLGNGGTVNDALDLDTGANDLQNSPVLTSVAQLSSTLALNGTFQGAPNASFTVDFYFTAVSAQNTPQGAIFIGSQVISTDGTGNATISFTQSGASFPAGFITATATQQTGNSTSEFSTPTPLGQTPGGFTWNGSVSSDWFDPSNWSPNGVPGSTDTVHLSSSSLPFQPILTSDAVIGMLDQSDGSLGGTAKLTVLGQFLWSGGREEGSGITLVMGSTQISGFAGKTLDGRTLDLRDTASRTGNGGFQIDNGGQLDIWGIFDEQGTVGFSHNTGASGAIHINPGGVFSKSAVGTVDVLGPGIALVNDGELDVLSGVLGLNGGGSGASGVYKVASGASLDFVFGSFALQGSTLFGGGGQITVPNGTVDILGTCHIGDIGTTFAVTGTLSVDGATTVDAGATLILNAGTLNGTSQLAIDGALFWQGGTMSGAGSTDVMPGGLLTITGPGTKVLNGRTLNNGGQAVLDSTDLAFNKGSINNQAAGSFDINGDVSLRDLDGATTVAVFSNDGLLTKSSGTGAGGFGPGIAVLNQGLVQAKSGDFAVGSAFTQSQGITALAGGSISGTLLTFTGGALGGSGTITADIANTSASVLPGGPGKIGTLTVTGNYTQGSAGTLVIELGGSALFDQLAVSGTTTLDGTLDIGSFGGFNPSNGQSFRVVQSAANPGTFAALSGLTAATTQSADATGLVITRGSAVFTWDNSSGDGSWFNPLNWDLDSGVPGPGDTAILNTLSVITLSANATVGTFTQTLGTVSTGPGLTFTILTAFNWMDGLQDGGGTIVVPAGSVATLGTNGSMSLENSTLEIGGTANWQGSGTLALTSSTLRVLAGGMLDLKTDSTLAGGDSVLEISGTVQKSSGSGTSTIGATVASDVPLSDMTTSVLSGGSVLVLSGTLDFISSISNAGTATSQSGVLGLTNFVQSAGALQLTGGAIQAYTALTLNGGELTGAGTITGDVTNSAGTVRPGGAAAGTLTITGVYSQGASATLAIDLGGTVAGTSHDQLAVTGSVQLDGTLSVTLINGFTTPFSTNFPVIAHGGSTGAFATFSGDTALLTTVYNANSTELQSAPPPPPPVLTVGNASIVEGQGGSKFLVFTVSLDATSDSPVSVHFATHDLAQAVAATAGVDYDLTEGDLAIAPGSRTATISVPVHGDTTPEARERFGLTLSAASGATLGNTEAFGSILDDDHNQFFTSKGLGSQVEIRQGNTARLVGKFAPFAPSYAGGVRVASGDVNGDGVNDLIAGAGIGGGARIRVYDGANVDANDRPLRLLDFPAFENAYRGGVYVAAGDVNGDGKADIIVAPSAGSSGLVRVFDGTTGQILKSFSPFGRGLGGVRVAAGDVDGDGRADVIVAGGVGSFVRVFDGLTGTVLTGTATNFRSLPRSYEGTISISSGDINGDGLDDIIVGAETDSSVVRVYYSGMPLSDFSQFNTSSVLKGVRVAAADINADGIADIITSQARNAGPRVRVFSGATVAGGNPSGIVTFDAFSSDLIGGVFVA